jgi:hypothetical protein
MAVITLEVQKTLTNGYGSIKTARAQTLPKSACL